MLIAGDISGIQSFLFDVAQEGGGQAQRLRARQKLEGVLWSRNSSILAHGLTAIQNSTYASLRNSLLEWLGQPALVQFPQMPD
jgi:hypothetical protein